MALENIRLYWRRALAALKGKTGNQKITGAAVGQANHQKYPPDDPRYHCAIIASTRDAKWFGTLSGVKDGDNI